MKNQKKGWKGRWRSFVNAAAGFRYFLQNEVNARIQIVVALAVIALGFWLQIDRFDWMILLSAIAFVLCMEMINTAIELIVDKIEPEYDKIAGLIKDLAAGAVLLAALYALVVGLMVFGRYVIAY